MEQVGYREWALIPVDPDPASGEPSHTRPPMMTAMAMDRNASLVFRFDPAPGELHIATEVTALTGESRGEDLFRLFTGSTAGAYREIRSTGWQLSHEGMYTSFQTRTQGVETYLKLLFAERRPIAVNQVTFARP